VGVFHPKDKELNSEVDRGDKDRVISFRPPDELSDKERIGEYELVFSALKKDSRTLEKHFRMGASIMASEKPFNGRADYKVLKSMVKQ
jgi:hypothetical protein